MNIHLIWLIDEYAIIFRKEEVFNPPIAPIIEDKIILTIKIFLSIKFLKNIIGAIFCHVIKIKFSIHLKLLMTSGNQLWNGAAPNFNINPIIIKQFVIPDNWIYIILFIKIENKIIIVPILCTRK